MSLEACPKCGYAVALTDRQCRHCFGLARHISKFSKRDVSLIFGAISIAVAATFAVYWMFFAR
jgi:hypothetical protein